MLLMMLMLFGGAACADAARDYRAMWVWAKVETAQPFQFVKFRKTFELSANPEHATAYIAADTLYRLWVNGRYVTSGPARSSFGKATIDPIDLSRFLRKGSNTVVADVFYGNVMFEALAQAPGFLCELEVEANGRTQVIGTDTSWEAQEDKTWNRRAPKFSFQRGWVEDVDSRLESSAKWQPAVILGKVGMAPWKTVEMRDVPLPASGDVKPALVVAMQQGGGPDQEPMSEKWVDRLNSEALSIVDKADVNASGMIAKGRGAVVLPGKGFSVTYDFVTPNIGFVGFDVTGKAGDVLELVWGERLRDNTLAPRPNQGLNSIQSMRYVLKGGRQSFVGFTVQLVRYLRVVNRSGDSVKFHRLWMTRHCFSGPQKGEFQSSDDDLNKIYAAAQMTLRLNMLDTFMDCPSRERGGWFHDSYWSALAAHTMFGDTTVSRRMIRQGADSQDDPGRVGPAGTVAMVYPARIRDCPQMIPAHELFWALQVGLDSRLTGDLGFTKSMLSAVRRLFEGLATWRNAEGLLEIPGGGQVWNFIDWADVKGGSISVGLNAVYAAALDDAGRMERLAGDSATGAAYDKIAKEVRDALNRWCTGDLYYPDVLERNEKGQLVPSREACETTQYYVMWANVPGEERTKRMWQAMRDDFVPTPTKKVQPIQGLNRAGLYPTFERLQVAARLSDHAALVRDAKAMYLPMATSAPGTLWESPWADSSLCHGFSSAVAAIITDEVLGIQHGFPLRITPHGGGSVRWCKGSAMTVRGRVGVDWDWKDARYTLRVSLPRGLSAEVSLPEEAKAIWAKSASKAPWSDTIHAKGRTEIIVTPGSVVVR